MSSTLQQALFQYLSTHPAVSALVGSRIYPLNLPQNPVYPAIAYKSVSLVAPVDHSGPADLLTRRMQFDIYAATYAAADLVAIALRSALNGYRGLMAGSVDVHGAFFQNQIDDFGDAAEVWRIAVDFQIMYKEQ